MSSKNKYSKSTAQASTSETTTPTPIPEVNNVVVTAPVPSNLVTVKQQAESVTPVKQVVAAKPVNQKVLVFNAIRDKYISMCQNKLPSNAELTSKINVFADLVRTILTFEDVQVYNAALKFFSENRNDILSENTVFRNIRTLSEAQMRQVSTVYTVLMALVDVASNKAKFCLDFDLIRSTLNISPTNPIYNWIVEKAHR